MPPQRETGAQLLVALTDKRRRGDLTADRREQLVVGHHANRTGATARR
jgi:hypothetical protein